MSVVMSGKLLLHGNTGKGKKHLTVIFPRSVKLVGSFLGFSMVYGTVKAIMMTGHDLTEASANRKAFAERLKTAISADGRSQDALAAEIGLSLSGFRKWLYGETEPQMSGLVRASNTLKVCLEWLATGKGPMREGDASAPTKSDHQPDDTISKKIAYNVIIALAPHFGITREPAQDELAELFLDLCDYLKEGSDSAPSQVIDFGMHRVRRSQAG